MTPPKVREEILIQLEHLHPDQQQKVLEYVRNLAIPPVKGTPGKNLLRFSGIFSKEDAHAIAEVIESDCERVDADEW